MAWQQVLDEIATYMATLYSDAETYLIETLAWRMERDMTIWDDDIARAQLINQMRREVAQQVALLEQSRPLLAEWIATTAVEEGAAGIRDVLSSILPSTTYGIPLGQAGLYAMTSVATDLASRFEDVNNRILRFPDDIHQKVDSVIVARKLTGAQHTIQFQREMLHDWYEWGIPSFTDVSGRTWRAGSYVEMVTRTGVQRALTEGRRSQLLESGFSFGLIHELHSACDRCAPWAGKVVSLTDSASPVQTMNLLTGRPITVRPKATVDEARRRGWQHPNCRGTLNAYIPGANTERFERPFDDVLNDAEAQLRETEREIRKQKRLIAIDPADQAAKRGLLDAQKQARQLVGEHEIMRRPWRESLDWSGDRIAKTRRTKPKPPARRGTPPALTQKQPELDA